ncbi:MAG: hypothetical protein R2720_01975 [Candidatus Nanopelagicales bacterium]
MTEESAPSTSKRSRTGQLLLLFVTVLALAFTGLDRAVANDKGQRKDDQQKVAAALAELRAEGMLYETSSRTPDVVPRQASTFGRSLFHGAAFAGGQVILSEILAGMGYDPEAERLQALKDINDSIAALNADVRRLSEQVELLLEGQDRSNLYNSYTQAGIAAANLDTAMRSVTAWIEKDLEPSESALANMQTVITTSIGQLDFLVQNATTGTVPLMMKAADPARVSNLESYWQKIDTVRDDYRAVLAQGLATLDVMRAWDTTGTVAADLETFTPRATQTVAGMYDYGVAIDAERVHVKGSTTLLTALGTKAAVGESNPRAIMYSSEIEPMLTSLADAYRPADHGGKSLEQYLQAHGLPTSYNYADTYGAFVRNNRWASVNQVGRISGNKYEIVERQFGQTYPLMSQEGFGAAQGQASHQRMLDGPTATRMTVSLNVGGRAADFTPASVKQAAFGLD